MIRQAAAHPIYAAEEIKLSPELISMAGNK
jgi:hypothetical protein